MDIMKIKNTWYSMKLIKTHNQIENWIEKFI